MELTLGLPFWGRCHLIEVPVDRDERVPPNITDALTPGGGGTAIYGLNGYVPLSRVWFSSSLL